MVINNKRNSSGHMAYGANPIIAAIVVIIVSVRRWSTRHSTPKPRRTRKSAAHPDKLISSRPISVQLTNSLDESYRISPKMYREEVRPILQDVLLNDQYLYDYSPAESIINFEIPTFVPEHRDWFSDLEFNNDSLTSTSENGGVSEIKDDFIFGDSSITFDFTALDKSIDDYLLEVLNSDRETDGLYSITDSSNSSDDILGVRSNFNTDLESMYEKTADDWVNCVNQNTESATTTIKIFGEPEFCPNLGAFRCPVDDCGKLYAKASHVRAHLRRHSGEKPYCCTWAGCSWKFARSDELARHRRSHSGDKPYGCRECGKRFARSDHLAKHGRVHARRAAAAAAAKRAASALPQRTRRLL